MLRLDWRGVGDGLRVRWVSVAAMHRAAEMPTPAGTGRLITWRLVDLHIYAPNIVIMH